MPTDLVDYLLLTQVQYNVKPACGLFPAQLDNQGADSIDKKMKKSYPKSCQKSIFERIPG